MSDQPEKKVDAGAAAKKADTGGAEKKKMLVLVALVVVVIAVGAFQFLGGSKPAATTTATTDTKATDTKTADTKGDGTTPIDDKTGTGDEGTGTVGDKVAVNAVGEQVKVLSARDPFQVPSDMVAMNQNPTPPVQEKHTPKPSGMSGDFKPFNPGGGGPILPNGGGSITPIAEPEPTFRVMGVLVGAHPMAVFEDDKGNQRLVALGGSVDGDTKVTKIERGRVTVVRHGKEKTLVIQEEARND